MRKPFSKTVPRSGVNRTHLWQFFDWHMCLCIEFEVSTTNCFLGNEANVNMFTEELHQYNLMSQSYKCNTAETQKASGEN